MGTGSSLLHLQGSTRQRMACSLDQEDHIACITQCASALSCCFWVDWAPRLTYAKPIARSSTSVK